MSLNFALVLGYFVFLIGGFALHSRTVDHSWLFLLRSFFPKWQFFHSLGQTPRLHYRHQTADEWSEWRKFTPRARRRPSQLFYNPCVNLALAEQNLVELLVQDLVACADGAAAPIAWWIGLHAQRPGISAHASPISSGSAWSVRGRRAILTPTRFCFRPSCLQKNGRVECRPLFPWPHAASRSCAGSV